MNYWGSMEINADVKRDQSTAVALLLPICRRKQYTCIQKVYTNSKYLSFEIIFLIGTHRVTIIQVLPISLQEVNLEQKCEVADPQK